MSRWWLDEHAHAGEEHLDPLYAAGYDRKAGFDPSEDLDALRLHGLDPDSVVVDLGAGTGKPSGHRRDVAWRDVGHRSGTSGVRGDGSS